MLEIFGDYRDDLNETDHEFLKIGFSPSSIPIQQRWRNNGLSADFAADYLATFFPIRSDNPSERRRRAEVKSAVSYIANELLENAMKYNHETDKYPIKFGLHLLEEEPSFKIVMLTTNSLAPQRLEQLQAFIQEFLATEPEEFYLQQMERSAAAEGDRPSGLGLITMKNDYLAQLGWKIETVQRDHPILSVTTMVQLTV